MCLYSHAINKRQSHKSTTVPEKCLLVCLSLLFFPCLFLQTGFFEKKINTLPSGARSSLSTCSLWYVQVGFEMIIQVQGVWSGSYRPNQCLYKQKTHSLSLWLALYQNEEPQIFDTPKHQSTSKSSCLVLSVYSYWRWVLLLYTEFSRQL